MDSASPVNCGLCPMVCSICGTISIDLVVCGNYKDILGAILAKEMVPLRIDFEISFFCKFLKALNPN